MFNRKKITLDRELKKEEKAERERGKSKKKDTAIAVFWADQSCLLQCPTQKVVVKRTYWI